MAATLVAWAAVRQVTDAVSPSTVLPLPSAVAIADQRSEIVQSPAPTHPGGEAKPDRADKPRNRAKPDIVTEPPAAAPPPAIQEPAEDAENPEAEEDTERSPTVTEAYELKGGVVTVRYSGSATRLISATPNSGFDVDVHDGGPGKVDVRFRSDDHESRLVTRVRDGAPEPQREERPR